MEWLNLLWRKMAAWRRPVWLFSDRCCLTCANRSEHLCSIPIWIPDGQLWGVAKINVMGGTGCAAWVPEKIYRKLRRRLTYKEAQLLITEQMAQGGPTP